MPKPMYWGQTQMLDHIADLEAERDRLREALLGCLHWIPNTAEGRADRAKAEAALGSEKARDE